jgi:hypothetical protein
MRQVRLGSDSGRPHQASDTGRQLLAWSIPSHVQAVPPAQECQGEGWYDDVTWTWGDYYEELTYITYE